MNDDDQAAALLRPEVTVVIPCLNEINSLGICIGKAKTAFAAMDVLGEVVVADNGSTDGSVELAEQLGARVVHQPIRGYGAALQAGIDAARAEFIIMGDADDSYDFLAIEPYVEALRAGADLVMGNRFMGGIEPGAMPWSHRWIGNPVLSTLARWAFNVPIGDFHCGMRGMTRRGWHLMRPTTTGMEFATEMIVGAARSGLNIVEIPTRLAKDQRGRPPHLRSFRDGWRHLRYIMSYAPEKFAVLPGAVLLMLGSVLQAILAAGPISFHGLYVGPHFLALAGLLSLIGLNVIGLGGLSCLLVADRYPQALQQNLRPLNRWLLQFSFERGLIAGSLVFMLGFALAAMSLTEWLVYWGAPMDHAIHRSFVATHLMALGMNIGFWSLVLHLMLQERKLRLNVGQTAPSAALGHDARNRIGERYQLDPYPYSAGK